MNDLSKIVKHTLMGKNIRARKGGVQWVYRIVSKDNYLAQYRNVETKYFMDRCRAIKHPGSGMWLVTGHNMQRPENQFKINSIEEGIKIIVDNVFMITWPRVKNKEVKRLLV